MKELITGPAVVEFVARGVRCTGFQPGATGIGLIQGGQIIAGLVYENYNGRNIEMHIATDGSRQWMTRYFRWAAFDYPFNQLGVERVTAVTASSNIPALQLNDRLGFKTEAVLVGAHPDGDLIIKCMRRADCRYIEEVKNEIRPLHAAA